MVRKNAVIVDNRDSSEMYSYLEARIDALKRRVAELEADNRKLRANWPGLHRANESASAFSQRLVG